MWSQARLHPPEPQTFSDIHDATVEHWAAKRGGFTGNETILVRTPTLIVFTSTALGTYTLWVLVKKEN